MFRGSLASQINSRIHGQIEIYCDLAVCILQTGTHKVARR
jgi:hypothetical protein